MVYTVVARFLAVCALLAVALSACGEEFEPGPLGAVEVRDGEPIRVAAMLALSGASLSGESIAAGVELAISHYGEIHGHAVALGEPLDSGCSLEGGAEAAREVVADPQIVGAIGTTCSSAATAAAPIISEAGLVMISASNTAPSLTSDLAGNAAEHFQRGYLRVADNGLGQAEAIAHFVYDELGLRRAVSVHDGDAFTSGLAAAFGDAFEALGGEVIVVEQIDKGASDMAAVLSGFAAAEPELVFFPLFTDDAAQLMRQARELKLLGDAVWITSDAAFTERFLAVPETEGVYAAGPTLDFGANVNEATGKSVGAALSEYRAQYGEPASVYWPHGYDAATLLLTAIESVAVVKGDTLYIDRAALREALYATASFNGLTGALGCDQFGDCGHGQVWIYHHPDAQVSDRAQLPVVYRYTPE